VETTCPAWAPGALQLDVLLAELRGVAAAAHDALVVGDDEVTGSSAASIVSWMNTSIAAQSSPSSGTAFCVDMNFADDSP